MSRTAGLSGLRWLPVVVIAAYVAGAMGQSVVPPADTTEPLAVEPGLSRPMPETVRGTTPADASPVRPARKSYRQFSPGVFVNPAYATENKTLSVEIWGVVVGLGDVDPVRFPGAAMFELIDGAIEVIEPKLGRIEVGGSFAVDEGTALLVRNRGNRPATLRAVIVKDGQR